MKNRKLALFLAVVMLLALFCSCSSSTETTSPEATSEASQPSETAQPSEAPAATPAAPAESSVPSDSGGTSIIAGYTENGFPIVDYTYQLPLFPEGYSLSMWVSLSDNMSTFMPNGFSDNTAYQKAMELTGANIEVRFASQMMNTEQFNLMIVSQDYTDIITGIDMLWTGGYDSAIDDNIFIDLTDMIENYMPVYSALYNQLDDNVKRDLHTDEGRFPKLISLSYDFAERTEGPMIRRDYLAQVGMDMPVTYDDWDAVLRAFKTELDISQPLMLPKGIVHTSNAMVSGFDVLGTFSTFPMITEPYYQVDNVVKYGIVEPGYKEYIEMIAGWYAEGIISPEFIVLNDNPMGPEYTAEIISGNAGIFFADGAMLKNYMSAGTAANPDFDIWALSEPVKEEGQITHFLDEKSPIIGRLSNIVVTTACDDLPSMGKFLDWFFTDVGAKLATVGVEGVSWEYDAQGNMARTDEWINSPLNDGEKPTLYIFSQVPNLLPDGVPEDEQYPAQEAAGPIWESNADSAYKLSTFISMTTEEKERYTNLYTDIQTYVEENLAKFVTGAKPLTEWDSFVNDVKAMGLDECTAIKQAALDRYLQR